MRHRRRNAVGWPGHRWRSRTSSATTAPLGVWLTRDMAITPADVQDRDGFIPLLKAVRRVFVFLQRNAQAKSNFAGRRQQRRR